MAKGSPPKSSTNLSRARVERSSGLALTLRQSASGAGISKFRAGATLRSSFAVLPTYCGGIGSAPVKWLESMKVDSQGEGDEKSSVYRGVHAAERDPVVGAPPVPPSGSATKG